MIRRYLAVLRLALMTSDAFSAIALFIAVVFVRFRVIDPQAQWNAPVDPRAVAIAYGVGWVACLWLVGLYRLRAHVGFRGEAFAILRAEVIATLVFLALLFALNFDDVSRLFMLLLVVSQPILTIASRFALREVLRWLRRHGYLKREMLIVGAGHDARAFADEVESERDLGLEVVGHLAGPHDSPVTRRPLIGNIDDLVNVLHELVIDEVAICLAPDDWSYVEPVTRICEDEGKIVRIAIGALGGALTGGEQDEVGGRPIVTFLYGPDRMLGLALKRLFDIAASAAGLVLLSPLFLALAAYVRFADGSPVLFRQVRVGLHGRPFVCLKFRTMVPDAEDRFEEVAHLNTVRGPAFKIANDPRLSRVGRFMRRTGLDELPQLLNVLCGEMSIVGPRPAPQREVAAYSVWHRRRLMMRPGLTGSWQVEARANDDFDRRAELDLDYIDHWSLWRDMKIVLRTIPAIVAAQGR